VLTQAPPFVSGGRCGSRAPTGCPLASRDRIKRPATQEVQLIAARLGLTFRLGPLGRSLGDALGADVSLRDGRVSVHVQITADIGVVEGLRTPRVLSIPEVDVSVDIDALGPSFGRGALGKDCGLVTIPPFGSP
jgi:hypothetical protein